MMSDKILAKGLFAKDIETKYGKMTSLTFITDEFIEFLKANTKDGKCLITIKKARSGVLYGEVFIPIPLDELPPKTVIDEIDLPF